MASAARAAVRCARLMDAWRPRICTASGHEAGVAGGPSDASSAYSTATGCDATMSGTAIAARSDGSAAKAGADGPSPSALTTGSRRRITSPSRPFVLQARLQRVGLESNGLPAAKLRTVHHEQRHTRRLCGSGRRQGGQHIGQRPPSIHQRESPSAGARRPQAAPAARPRDPRPSPWRPRPDDGPPRRERGRS